MSALAGICMKVIALNCDFCSLFVRNSYIANLDTNFALVIIYEGQLLSTFSYFLYLGKKKNTMQSSSKICVINHANKNCVTIYNFIIYIFNVCVSVSWNCRGGTSAKSDSSICVRALTKLKNAIITRKEGKLRITLKVLLADSWVAIQCSLENLTKNPP